MTHTTYYTASTLDGYIADEHDSLDWLFVQESDPDGPMGYEDFIKDIGALAMGATTYLWVLDHMAAHGEKWSYTVPTWVFTHRDLDIPADADVRFTAGQVSEVYEEMAKAADGRGIWMVGGGDLAGQFADAGLLDEIVVSIAPVTLGRGKPLFPRRYDLELLELARSKDFATARYRVVAGRS